MKHSVILGIILCSFAGYGQVDSVQFQTGKSWADIVELAQQENKCIFVDCYATWCGPCKWMDEHVYNNPWLAAIVNSHFICMKLQMDSTKTDNVEARKHYPLAHSFVRDYRVNELPTFLFFSPSGAIVDKFSGAMTDSSFLTFVINALDPGKQYYGLVKKLETGTLSRESLIGLMKRAKNRDDESTERTIAKYYVGKFGREISGTSEEDKASIQLFSYFLGDILTSRDSLFHLFYYHGDRVDTIVHYPKYSEGMICGIIAKEELASSVSQAEKQNGEPDWAGLNKHIAKKFNERYAEEVILDAQVDWYGKKKDYLKMSRFLVRKLDRFGIDTAGAGKIGINNQLYSIVFKYSADKDDLQKAAGLMRVIIDGNPKDIDSMDTYANLLYKSGDVENALVWEAKAAQIRPSEKEIQDNLAKMKAGLPTWQ